MNITLFIDEKTVIEAQKVAQAMGKSLNQTIREDLQRFTQQGPGQQSLEEFIELSGQGGSQGWELNRDELYEGAQFSR